MKNIMNKIVNVLKDKDGKAEMMYNSYKTSTGIYRAYAEIEEQR